MKSNLKNIPDRLRAILAEDQDICFAYLFGSQARQRTGGLSDIDVAVYLVEGVDAFEYRLRLMETIMKAIKADDVDIVVLNYATPLLRHEVVKNSTVLKDNREHRLAFEMKILTEYLDTEHLRNTHLHYLKESLRMGTYFG